MNPLLGAALESALSHTRSRSEKLRAALGLLEAEGIVRSDWQKVARDRGTRYLVTLSDGSGERRLSTAELELVLIGVLAGARPRADWRGRVRGDRARVLESLGMVTSEERAEIERSAGSPLLERLSEAECAERIRRAESLAREPYARKVQALELELSELRDRLREETGRAEAAEQELEHARAARRLEHARAEAAELRLEELGA